MHSASTEFVETINEPHVVVERIEFFFPEGDAGPSFEVEDGDFTIDADAAVRHNASFQLGTDDVDPAAVADALATEGTTVAYSRGMRLANGEPELKRVLTGKIAVGEIGGSREGTDPIPVTVFDSWTRLQEEARHSFAIPTGRNYATAAKNLVLQFAPEIRWADIMSTPWTTPSLLYPVSTIPATVIAEMAEAIGAEAYFDAYDRMNLVPVPLTYGRAPGWTFDCDDPAGGVIKIKVKNRHDRIPNGVIVVGQHSSTSGQVVGEAWDDNPTSNTYSGIRRRSITKRTEKAITIPQAEAMARGLLEKILGRSEEIELTIQPNPLLTSGALCRVKSDRYRVNGNYVLKAISGSVGRENVGEPWKVTLRRGVTPASLEAT